MLKIASVFSIVPMEPLLIRLLEKEYVRHCVLLDSSATLFPAVASPNVLRDIGLRISPISVSQSAVLALLIIPLVFA
jgi:hypothetical protein